MQVHGYKTEYGMDLPQAGGVRKLNTSEPDMARSRSIVHGVICLMSLLPLAVQAQVPGVGEAIRNIESLQQTLPPSSDVELDIPKVQEPRPAPPQAQGMRLLVHEFRIEGNRDFDTPRLLALVADLQEHELSLADLRAAAQRVTAFYQEHGYVLARAFLPAQDIEHGVVRIEVLEARYDHIELQNRSRALDGVLRQPLSSLKSGGAVYDASLERSLLLLSDIPGVVVKGTLQPGAQRGTTDLIIDADSGSFATGELNADNYGSTYTGEYRLGGSINLNNPLRLGDQFSLWALTSDKQQRYYRGAYRLPIGPWSTTVGVSYSEMAYRLGKEFEVLEAHGRASIRSLFVSQPLIRSRSFDLSAQLQYDDKLLRDDMDLVNSRSQKNVELWTLGLNGSSQDSVLGGGQNLFSLSYSSGQLRFHDHLEEKRDRLSAGSGGSFGRANLNLARLQRLSDRFQFYTQLNAQWASANLDGSEEFGLGGPNGVRAYVLGAGSGDQGFLASAELRYLPVPGWQFSVFADKGVTEVNKHPWTSESNTRSLSAAGAAARWVGGSHQVSLTAAWPIKNADQDDVPHQDPRVWVSATQYF